LVKKHTTSKSLRALIVEDQVADAELLLYNLRKAGFDVSADVVSDPEEMRQTLSTHDHDIVFSDFNLAGWNALEGLEIFKASCKNIPFIVVSGTIGDVQAVECIRNGATDYVLKDNMMPRLGIAIERSLSNFAVLHDKKRTESALQASKEALLSAENRFEKIFQLSPDATAITALETARFFDVNEAYVKLSGYARTELIGRTAIEIGLWSSNEVRNAVIKRLKRDGRIRHEEFEFRVKDGRLRSGLYSAELVHFGGESYVLAVIRDITERRAIEERLRLSSKILNAIGNLVLVANDKGEIIYASPSVKQILGYTPAEVLGDNWWRLTCSEVEAKQLKEKEIRVARGDVEVGELPADRLVPHKDGSLRCLLWQHSKSDSLVITVGQDITELKQIELALRVSQDRYRLLFDSNPQPMWVYDLETLRYRDVNEAAIEQYGYSRTEFLRMSIRDIRPPEEIPRLLSEVERVKKSDSHDTRDVWKHRTKTGTLIDVEIAAHKIILDGRNSVLILAKDVTEQHRLQIQLQQSQKMEAVGQLAGGISHDFNNLLGIIMGQAELLIDKLEDPASRRRAESIVKAADRGASLTSQLLAFSRKQTLNPTPIALNELVRESARLLGRTLGEDIKLETVLEEGLWATKIDPGQIQDVILNLAINARDAMPKGGKLTIKTFNVPSEDVNLKGVEGAPGDYVCLAVADNGQGMTEEVRARVFEPFFTTKAEGKGTGLGLAMVYGIVKQSGGQIWVYSEIGKGTAFKLYFPRTMSAVKSAEPRLTATSGGTETVLIVEDQDGFREVMADVLKENGYTVIEAINGKDALSKIEQHKGTVDMVVSDVIMPEMSGADLATELKGILPGVKMLFVSGYTGDAMYRQGGFTETAEFLQKPFTPSALARRVRSVLDKKNGRS
jgi:two-component system cell cycle sensor histidine kinase/response regulator CckA